MDGFVKMYSHTEKSNQGTHRQNIAIPGTYLQDIVIPQLLVSADKNLNFFRLLTKLQAKLLAIHDPPVQEMYFKNVYATSPHGHPMMVLFIFRPYIEERIRTIKNAGSSHVVRSSWDSQFQVIEAHTGRTSIFTPYLAKGLSSLEASGLNRFCIKVDTMGNALKNKEKLKKQRTYFRTLQDVLGKVREPPTFHESNPVSIDLVLPAISICAILLSLGLVVFAVENCKIIKLIANIVVSSTKTWFNRTRIVLKSLKTAILVKTKTMWGFTSRKLIAVLTR